jgi:hypothetical protein
MRFTFLIVLLFLAGCASTTGDVGATVKTCCPGSQAQSFAIETRHVPPFLNKLLASNLSTVLAMKGLQPVEKEADLKVIVSYEQEDLAIAVRQNDFDERVSEGGDVRFVAKIVVQMRDPMGELVFDGSVQRIHEVSPGEFMHTGVASVAIFEAFQAMLADYRLP